MGLGCYSVNQPSRDGVLPIMSSSDVAADDRSSYVILSMFFRHFQ